MRQTHTLENNTQNFFIRWLRSNTSLKTTQTKLDLVFASQKHPFHILGPSPLPFLTGLFTFAWLVPQVFVRHGYETGLPQADIRHAAILGLFATIRSWFFEILAESGQGYHTKRVQAGLRLGRLLFIASEVRFFFAFFWGFFHFSLVPSIAIGAVWPPKGTQQLSPWGFPLVNTRLFLTSGLTITVAHAYIIKDRNEGFAWFLFLIIVLGTVFLFCQAYEYKYGVTFSWRDNVYGSIFFIIPLTSKNPLHKLFCQTTSRLNCNLPQKTTTLKMPLGLVKKRQVLNGLKQIPKIKHEPRQACLGCFIYTITWGHFGTPPYKSDYTSARSEAPDHCNYVNLTTEQLRKRIRKQNGIEDKRPEDTIYLNWVNKVDRTSLEWSHRRSLALEDRHKLRCEDKGGWRGKAKEIDCPLNSLPAEKTKTTTSAASQRGAGAQVEQDSSVEETSPALIIKSLAKEYKNSLDFEEDDGDIARSILNTSAVKARVIAEKTQEHFTTKSTVDVNIKFSEDILNADALGLEINGNLQQNALLLATYHDFSPEENPDEIEAYGDVIAQQDALQTCLLEHLQRKEEFKLARENEVLDDPKVKKAREAYLLAIEAESASELAIQANFQLEKPQKENVLTLSEATEKLKLAYWEYVQYKNSLKTELHPVSDLSDPALKPFFIEIDLAAEELLAIEKKIRDAHSPELQLGALEVTELAKLAKIKAEASRQVILGPQPINFLEAIESSSRRGKTTFPRFTNKAGTENLAEAVQLRGKHLPKQPITLLKNSKDLSKKSSLTDPKKPAPANEEVKTKNVEPSNDNFSSGSNPKPKFNPGPANSERHNNEAPIAPSPSPSPGLSLALEGEFVHAAFQALGTVFSPDFCTLLPYWAILHAFIRTLTQIYLSFILSHRPTRVIPYLKRQAQWLGFKSSIIIRGYQHRYLLLLTFSGLSRIFLLLILFF